MRVKGMKYIVMEGELTLGRQHTTSYIDDVLQNCILKNYVILPTIVIPIHLIKLKKKKEVTTEP